MRLLLYELRKIWDAKLLVGVVVLVALVYYVLMHWYVMVFPNGHSATEEHAFVLKMSEEFGPTLEADEFERTGVWLDELYAQADAIVQSDPRIAPLGFTSYRELLQAYYDMLSPGDMDESLNQAEELIFGSLQSAQGQSPEYGFLGYHIQALEQIRERYVLQAEQGDGNTGIMMSELALREYFFPATACMLLLIPLMVASLLAFTLTRDRAARVDALQLSSRRGRRIYNSQLLAMLVSAFAVTTVLLAAFTLLFVLRMDIVVLWNNPLESFMGWGEPLMLSGIDLTLGQYYLMLVAFIYVSVVGLTLALLCLSGKSSNYVSALAKAIPAFVVVGILGGALLAWRGLFTYPYYDSFYRNLFGGLLFEPFVPLVILIVGTVMAWGFLRSRRRTEL